MEKIDTTNMCSHLQKKLFDEEGVYNHIWKAMQNDISIAMLKKF